MGTACSPIQLLLATLGPQAHEKCVIPVKYLYGVWCWSLWWCFLAGWLKKSNQRQQKRKKKKKKPKPPPHIRAHGGALQSQPCFHRGAEIQSITQTEAAQDDSHTQPGHQLKCLTQIKPISSCIQFKRQAGRIPIISTFFLLLLPSHCRDTQLHPNLPKSYAATSPNGTWELKVYLQQNSSHLQKLL